MYGGAASPSGGGGKAVAYQVTAEEP